LIIEIEGAVRHLLRLVNLKANALQVRQVGVIFWRARFEAFAAPCHIAR
jgi:hypothetical protein